MRGSQEHADEPAGVELGRADQAGEAFVIRSKIARVGENDRPGDAAVLAPPDAEASRRVDAIGVRRTDDDVVHPLEGPLRQVSDDSRS